jgi:hypothetical protein
MWNKIKEIAKNRGIVIGISVEGEILNVSIIPKSLTERLVPVSFSCNVEQIEEYMNKALDEMIDMKPYIMQTEAFIESAKKKEEKKEEKKAEKKPKPEKNTPDIFNTPKEELNIDNEETINDEEYEGNGDTDEEHGLPEDNEKPIDAPKVAPKVAKEEKPKEPVKTVEDLF